MAPPGLGPQQSGVWAMEGPRWPVGETETEVLAGPTGKRSAGPLGNSLQVERASVLAAVQRQACARGTGQGLFTNVAFDLERYSFLRGTAPYYRGCCHGYSWLATHCESRELGPAAGAVPLAERGLPRSSHP